MKHGDFSSLAKEYVHRPGYSRTVLQFLLTVQGGARSGFKVADIGAGTGKLTQDLLALGLDVICVEPNDLMREEGIRVTGGQVSWRSGSGESTNLSTSSVNWVLVGSAFHWFDPNKALPEFHRILHPGGYLTALWNPRDIEKSELQQRIETKIREIIPGLKRVSSGGRSYTEDMFRTMVSTGHFGEVTLIEVPHEVRMTPERYMGVWRSVNDIQVQAGPERWPKVLFAIEQEIADLTEIVVPYRTRSFSAKRLE